LHLDFTKRELLKIWEKREISLETKEELGEGIPIEMATEEVEVDEPEAKTYP